MRVACAVSIVLGTADCDVADLGELFCDVA